MRFAAQLPKAIRDADAESRTRWSITCAAVIAKGLSRSPDLLFAIVGGGEALFIKRARAQYRGHGFDREDYQRIFAYLCHEAARVEAAGRVALAREPPEKSDPVLTVMQHGRIITEES